MYTMPKHPILLSNELNISFIPSQVGTHSMFGLSGINVYPWPALHFAKDFWFYFSTIRFYVNNTSPSGYSCSPGLIPDNSYKSVSLFSTYIDVFRIMIGNKHESSPVCPYLLKNANLKEIWLEYQVDSFLFSNLFRFQQTNETTLFSINSKISSLVIEDGYNYKLDTGLLHPLVFEKINQITCSGTIKSIQINIFKDFGLVELKFDLTSLGNFYHQIGIEWMTYLKNGSNVQITSDNLYTYPDRDFCIFAQFPLKRKIHLDLDKYSGPNCTFTYAWLSNMSEMNFSLCKKQNLSVDKLDAMLKLCEVMKNETNNSYPAYPEYYQIRVINMLFMEMVPFVLIPCACMIGLFLNWKIIQTIRKNKKKDLKEDFYKYMSTNAKFNCIYCVVFVFYPMTRCSWRLSYYFCSSIFTTYIVQYYKIVMMAYFGEVIKMCANCSYLMMTLNRYLLVGKDHAHWLSTIAKLEFKWVVRGLLLVSALINIGHGWEFQAGDSLAMLASFSDTYDLVNGNSYSDYPQANHDLWYFIYSIVCFFINFGFFFVLNTGIEVKMVRRMHKELKEKRERHDRMNAEKLCPSVDVTDSAEKNFEKSKIEKEDMIKERNVIKMVVYNGILNFILRVPEIFFWLQYENIIVLLMPSIQSNFYNSFLLEIKMYMPGFLSFFVDISYLTYILTFTTNFIIFYMYNKNFKEAVIFRSPSSQKTPKS
jgi:hypothetical protein